MNSAWIDEPVAVLAVLLAVLAGLFFAAGRPAGARFFRVVPLLIFAYFIPTALSNIGLIPLKSPIYDLIKTWLLPASLLLLTMSVDIPAIMKLGRNVLILFAGGTLSIVIGGPLAYLALGGLIPPQTEIVEREQDTAVVNQDNVASDAETEAESVPRDQIWKGLAALSGSWIGGGANFVAIGESVGTTDSMLGTMVVIDVVLANLWMAVLLFFAANEKQMDARLGADRSALDDVKQRIESYHKEVSRETTLETLFSILAIAFGGTVIATYLGNFVASSVESAAANEEILTSVRRLAAEVDKILNPFAWTVIFVTALGVAASFTRLRRLEGAGASKIGSLFLYLLVASIGAKAEFVRVADTPVLLLIAALWIAIHAAFLLALRWILKAPVFFLAVGSQANIGGAASAPIVAGAFHPSLAPVGALMGVLGYVVGTYAGLLCAYLLQLVHGVYY